MTGFVLLLALLLPVSCRLQYPVTAASLGATVLLGRIGYFEVSRAVVQRTLGLADSYRFDLLCSRQARCSAEVANIVLREQPSLCALILSALASSCLQTQQLTGSAPACIAAEAQHTIRSASTVTTHCAGSLHAGLPPRTQHGSNVACLSFVLAWLSVLILTHYCPLLMCWISYALAGLCLW